MKFKLVSSICAHVPKYSCTQVHFQCTYMYSVLMKGCQFSADNQNKKRGREEVTAKGALQSQKFPKWQILFAKWQINIFRWKIVFGQSRLNIRNGRLLLDNRRSGLRNR